MKSLSTTAVAAVFAVSFTLLACLIHLAIPIMDAAAGDQMVSLRYDLQKKHGGHSPDSRIILAAVDEQTVQQLGAWPFARSVHAQFLHVLTPEKPKVIGWDILFTEAKGLGAPAAAPDPTAAAAAVSDDQMLVDEAAAFPHMVHAASRSVDFQPPFASDDILPTKPMPNIEGDPSSLLSGKYALLPFPELRKKTYFGFVDEMDDVGGVRRQMPLVINIQGKVLPSFDLQIVMQYLGVEPDQVHVRIGHEITLPKPDGTTLSIPIDEQGRLTLNYRARLEDFQAMSYAWMGKGLTDKAANQTSDESSHLPPIADHIVVVGVTFAGTDAGPTPLSGVTPLVVTHLNVINNILQGDFLRPVGMLIWAPIYAVFLFIMGSLMLRVGTGPLIPIGVFGILFLAVAAFGLLWSGNNLVPIGSPELGLLLLSIAIPTRRFFGEERAKTHIKSAMSAYLSEKIMAKVLEHPDAMNLGGVKQHITVMFCDIRGFTAYCDERDPALTLDVLNEYFEMMTQVVFKYDGTTDKYIGDCIMAFWNAPQPQADHAQRAVCCAMEMRYALANFKTQRAGIDREIFECGIGIHTGEALVGIMGSSIKRNYTAIGSTVNMAARLETLTKRLNERILISQDVLDQLQGDFPLTDRGEATVPGFAKPIHVYAVTADQDITSALQVGRKLAVQQEYTAEEAVEPIWQPAPLPEDAEPNEPTEENNPPS